MYVKNYSNVFITNEATFKNDFFSVEKLDMTQLHIWLIYIW